MADYNAEVAQERHEHVMKKLDELMVKADRTNGHIHDHATRLAVLEERNPGKQGGAWGAIAGAVGGFLAGFIK